MASSPELSFDPASMSNAVSFSKTIFEFKKGGGKRREFLDEKEKAMRTLVFAVLDDCLENIIADAVLKVHREEKLLRMQSAAILAQQTKDAARAEASPGGAPTSMTTPGATIDEDDRIFLHSNPIRSTPEILCPTCRLPRLLYPTMGKGSRPPDPSKTYCAKQPFIEKDGCDIYGKSLTAEKPSKKKATDKKSKPGSRSGSESPTDSPASKPAAASIPSGKCPFCPRYMAFTRIAQHMDRCLKANARQTGKNAAVSKLAGTPQDTSRASTPKPSGAAANNADKDKNKKRKLANNASDDDEEVTPVKKKKVKKEKKESTPGPESKGKKEGKAGTPRPK